MTCGGPDMPCSGGSISKGRTAYQAVAYRRSHVVSQQRVERLLCQPKAARLAAEIGKLDPHLGVLPRRDDESAHFENALPYVNLTLATRQSASNEPVSGESELWLERLTASSKSSG